MYKKFFLCFVVLLGLVVMIAMIPHGHAHAGGFIKPNVELLTYRPTKDHKNYRLDYLMGLSFGYQTRAFVVMLSSDYLWHKRAVLLSTATDYQWQGDIARFLLGGQVSAQLATDKKTCPAPCRTTFLLVPRLGVGFRVGSDSWIGLMSKVYLPINKEISNPYYSLGVDTTIGF